MLSRSLLSPLGLRRFLVLLVVSAAPHAHAETLYNGIELPTPWPPETKITREPMAVPYLAQPPKVIPINVGRQLLVDDFLISETNLTRSFHSPKPYQGNPIVQNDQPWEKAGDASLAMPFSDGVWFDPKDQLFKMWYTANVPEGAIAQLPKGGMVTCYAISKDGLVWQKPKLNSAVPGTNIVLLAPRDSTFVWLDSRPGDPAKRFSLMRTYKEEGEGNPWLSSVHFSADGIHWTDTVATTKGLKWFSDRTTGFFNAFRNVWVYSVRNTIRQDPEFLLTRVRHYNESTDLAAGLTQWERHPWVGSDRLDPRNPKYSDFQPQLYNVDAVAYESLMLGLFSVLEGPENDISKAQNIHKRNEVFVAFSRDGYHWDRPNRNVFIGVNESAGAWNWGNVQSVGGICTIVGDQLYFYYSGRGDKRGAGMTGVAFLRRDGFASMDGGATGGSLTTRPLTFTGNRLFINAEAAGGITAEMLDESGTVLPGFGRAEAKSARGDKTRLELTWKGHPDLSSLAAKPIRLRFHLSAGAKLYSFWVSPDKDGASNGYLAAGGPGYLSNLDAQRR